MHVFIRFGGVISCLGEIRSLEFSHGTTVTDARANWIGGEPSNALDLVALEGTGARRGRSTVVSTVVLAAGCLDANALLFRRLLSLLSPPRRDHGLSRGVGPDAARQHGVFWLRGEMGWRE